jgi:hypothetical protein
VGGNGVFVGIAVAVALGEIEATVGGRGVPATSGTWATWVPQPLNTAKIRQQIRIRFAPSVLFILSSLILFRVIIDHLLFRLAPWLSLVLGSGPVSFRRWPTSSSMLANPDRLPV